MKIFNSMRLKLDGFSAQSTGPDYDAGRWIEFCFHLLLGRTVAPATVEQRLKLRPREQPLRIAKSPEFQEKVVTPFLSGLSVPPPDLNSFDARELSEAISRSGGEPPALADGTVSWTRAFEAFCMSVQPLKGGWAELLNSDKKGPLGRFGDALNTLAEIDAHVEAGRIYEAYWLAHGRAEAGDRFVSARYCALIWALCPDPVELEAVLDLPAVTSTAALVTAMRAQRAAMLDAPSQPSLRQSAKAILPPAYLDLLEADARSDRLEDAVVIWSLLRRPAHGPGGDSKLKVVMPQGSDDPGPVPINADIFLVGKGPEVGGIRHFESWAEAKSELVSDQATQPVMILDRPIAISTGLVDLLPRVIDPEQPIYCTRDTFAAYRDGGAVGGLAATGSDLVGILAASADAAFAAFDVAKAAIVPSSNNRSAPIVAAAEIIEIETPAPDDALVIAAEPVAKGLVGLQVDPGASCAEVAAELRKLIDQKQISIEKPVLTRSPNINYQADYNPVMLRSFARTAAKLPVCAAEICLQEDDFSIAASPTLPGNLCKSGFLALSAMTAADLLKRLDEAGDYPVFSAACRFPVAAVRSMDCAATLAQNKLVMAQYCLELAAAPALAAVIFDTLKRPAGLTDTGAVGLGMPVAHATYFRRIERVRRTIRSFATQEAGSTQAFVGALSAGTLFALRDEIDPAEVGAAIEATFGDVAFLTSIEVSVFDTLIELAQCYGLQVSAGQKLYSVLSSICLDDYRKIRSAFSFVNGAVSASDFHALLAEFTGQVAAGKPRMRLVNRTLDVLCAYASPRRVAAFVDAARRNASANFLSDKNVRSKLASKLAGQDKLFEQLPKNQCEYLAEIIPNVALKERLFAALSSGNRAAFLTTLQTMSSRQDAVEWLGAALSSYTAELSEMQITAEDWPYTLYSGTQSVANLAAVLGDVAVINAISANDLSPDWRAISSARTGRFDALNQRYSDLCEPWDITPVSFAGDSISSLFASLAGQPLSGGKDGPLVSVIVTVFNGDPELLRYSVGSILAQISAAIEIILVDDCSEDEFSQAYRDIAETDDRITYLRGGTNTGPYLGRNLALHHARGTFVAIQDADDFAHPERFAFQLARFAEAPQLQACSTTHIRFDRNACPQFEHGMKLVGDGTMSTMFRRSLFDELGPFAAVRSRGDVEYRERIRKAFGPGAFRLFPCPMQFCFAAPSTLSHTIARERGQYLADFRQIIDRQCWQSVDGRPVRIGEIAIPAALRP